MVVDCSALLQISRRRSVTYKLDMPWHRVFRLGMGLSLEREHSVAIRAAFEHFNTREPQGWERNERGVVAREPF